MFKVLMGTVNSGSNLFEITDNEISDESIIEVYSGDESIIPVEVSVTGHVLLVTFDVKASDDIPIKIFINNLEGEYIPPSSGTAYDIFWRTIPGIGDESVGDGLDAIQERAVNTEEALYTKVPEQTVPGGVLYHATSGNTWKKLDASNLDYDEQSTIYSAMGNIDELETTATNLVDAINEVKEGSGGGGGYVQPFDNTPVKIGKIGEKDLYAVRCVTNNVPHTSWSVIGTVPANTTIIKIGGCFEGSYAGQRLVGDLYDNYGGGWNNSYQISGNNVQAYCGTNVSRIDLFIEFYYND